jgi:hypothetical protein
MENLRLFDLLAAQVEKNPGNYFLSEKKKINGGNLTPKESKM